MVPHEAKLPLNLSVWATNDALESLCFGKSSDGYVTSVETIVAVLEPFPHCQWSGARFRHIVVSEQGWDMDKGQGGPGMQPSPADLTHITVAVDRKFHRFSKVLRLCEKNSSLGLGICLSRWALLRNFLFARLTVAWLLHKLLFHPEPITFLSCSACQTKKWCLFGKSLGNAIPHGETNWSPPRHTF